jgi:mono/diheme cytochrome c family protein
MDAHHTVPQKEHHTPLSVYVGIFLLLTAITVFECLPLFGLLHIPPPILLFLSAVKFTVVVLFFMHIWGDKPINARVFFIPLVMAGISVATLMALFGTWRLEYQETSRGRDSDEVAARYRSRWHEPCNNWAKSPFTGNEYCQSPVIAFTTMAAYDALKAPAAADPAFDGFDAKSDDEKKQVLLTAGEKVFGANCAACHQATGLGIAGTFPPLAGDPVANGGPAEEHIKIVLNGLTGKPINGVGYAAGMQAWRGVLSDEQIAAAISFERNSWGNNGGIVEPKAVKALR